MLGRDLLRNCLSSNKKIDFGEFVKDFSDDELLGLTYDWKLWAREKQLPSRNDWVTWLILAGRGWGKTRVGAEQIRMWQESGVKRLALIGQTPKEVRDVMIEGESGLLAISPPWNMPKYESSKGRVSWNNGASALVYSGENPEALRGPQHEKAWVDELAKFAYAQKAMDNLMFGLRLGDMPQVLITTTPRPTKTIKELINLKSTLITKGSTFENKANLSSVFLEVILDKYQGTRLGRQELEAEMLDDVPEALWQREIIERNRILKSPDMKRIVVAIDPSTTNNDGSDEAGIIVAGIDENNISYILEDISIKASPKNWAEIAIAAYYKWSADRIIGEANNGGDMIETILRGIDNNVSYKKVWASRGKATRAEPIAALYEQDKVKHVGFYELLEDEYCEWVPGSKSPNRLDAAVWALTELMITKTARMRPLKRTRLGL